MNNLAPIEFKKQRIMTTKVLAEQYNATETMITQNYNNNKGRFVEGKHFYKLQGEELKEFKRVIDNIDDPSIKFASVLILWTDRGAARHAKILDTDEAWEVYEQLEENYFNPKQNKYIGLSKELQAIFMLDEKTQKIESRIDKLENTMTIDYSQQEELRTKATRRVLEMLGGKEVPAYKELNKKAFSQIWKDYKKALDVNSYRNTAVKDFDKALSFVTAWKPNRDLELMIMGSNSQMRI